MLSGLLIGNAMATLIREDYNTLLGSPFVTDSCDRYVIESDRLSLIEKCDIIGLIK